MADNRLRGKISGRAGMRGNLNSAYIPIYYNGVKTDTIEVIVDNIEKTIKANLIKGMTGEGAVRFDMVQGLTNAERERARRNIGAVEANPSIPSPSQYLLVRYDNKGLVTSSRRIEKDDLPKELNGHIFLDDVTLQKDLRLNGNLYQNGAAYELHATKVLTKNDYIFMRDGAVSGLADDEYTGLIANDYNGKGDYGALIYDKKGVARVGDVTFKFESMSTKPETLEKAYGYFYHDDETNKFRVIDGTFTEEQYAKLERVYREKVITNETQAIATRLEEGDANLVDNKLVIWDAEKHILTAPNFKYEQTNDTSEPSADDGEISYISDIQVDQNGRVSSTNIRKSTIKKSWRPVKVNGEEFLIATDGKTINFKDGSSIILTKVNDNAELTISINNKANEDDKKENDTDSEAFQFLNYNTEGLITSKKATARRKAIKLSTASSELLLSTVYGTDNKDLILYGPKRQIAESKEKRYLLGSVRTDDMADTDTNHLAYMQNGVLFSNNSTVLNSADTHVITGHFYFQDGLSIPPEKSIHFRSYYGTEKSKLDIDADGNLTFNADLTLTKNRIKTSSGKYLNYSDEEAQVASTDTEQEITGKKTLSGELLLNHNLDIASDGTLVVGSSDKKLKEIYAIEFKGNSTSSDKVNHTLKYSSGKGETQEFDGSEARDLTDKVLDLFNNQNVLGEKTFKDKTTIDNNAIINGAVNITGNLHIAGDIVQEGKTYETHAEHVYTTKDVIITRDGATQALGSNEYSGIVASKYDGTNDGGLIFDSNGLARVGDISYDKETGKIVLNDTQPLATREEAPVDKGLGIWDDATHRFITSANVKYTDKLLYNNSEVINVADNQEITGKKKFSGEIELNNNIVSSENETFIIGSETKRLNAIFVKNLYGNASTADKVNNKLILKNDNNTYYNGEAEVNLSDYYVDKVNAQTVMGAKSFTDEASFDSNVTFGADLYLRGVSDNYKDTLSKIIFGDTSTKYSYITSDISGNIALLDGNNKGIIYHSSSDVSPEGASIDLGRNTDKWKDLYLSGYLSNGTKTVTVANIVDTNTAQTITGAKTLNNEGNKYKVVSADGEAYASVILGSDTSELPSLRKHADLLFRASDSTLAVKNINVAANVTDGENSKTVKEIVDTVNKVVTMETNAQENRIETISSGEIATKLTIDKDKNVNIPYASIDVGGVVKINLAKGISINDGVVETVKASNDEIDAKTDNYKVITPSNLDYAVKSIGKDEYVDFTSDQTITGKKTFDSQIIGNAGANITGDLTVKGNIYQTGTTYETHAEKVYSKKDYIYLREGASSALAEGNFSGLEFIKYDGTNNGRLVVDKNGVARVGDVGDEQPLATREEIPIENGYAKWDNTNSRFKTINLETLRSEVGTSTTANTDKLLFNTYTKDGLINDIVKQVYNKKLTINGVDRNIITDADSDLAPIYAAEVAGANDGEILQWDATTGKPKWAASASTVTVYDGLDQAVHMEGRALSAHQGYVLDNKKVDKEYKYTPEGGVQTTFTIYNGDADSILTEEGTKMLGMMASDATFDSEGEITGGGHTILDIETKLGVLLTQNSSGNIAQVATSLDDGDVHVTLDAIDCVNRHQVDIALDANSNAIILNTTSSQLVLSENVLTPSGNGAFDLGASSSRFKDLYLAGNLSDGTNEIAVANIANVSQVPQVEDIRNLS